jgi:hypothetical protein
VEWWNNGVGLILLFHVFTGSLPLFLYSNNPTFLCFNGRQLSMNGCCGQARRRGSTQAGLKVVGWSSAPRIVGCTGKKSSSNPGSPMIVCIALQIENPD